MSKFYTYEELQKGIPTKKTVTEVRDRLIDYLRTNTVQGSLLLYGSTVWSIGRHFDVQHTRRSDIDIAENAKIRREVRYRGEDLENFCKNISLETNVPVQLTQVGRVDHYQGLINPSTADHFRLLAKRFPNDGYKDFKSVLQVKYKDRVVDLDNYIGETRWLVKFLHSRNPIVDWRKPNNLNTLSTLENFPDHIIRKVLGKEKALPCPDSKMIVREAFRNLPRQWRIRDELQPSFDKVIEYSKKYEALIANGKKLTQTFYEQKVGEIANGILKTTKEILDKIPYSIRELL